ncbi:hypothetical protein ALC60_00256 [Trachymyrmex zeteki]|uniref:Uncharacterized protein n=1 Tax=Mycetomoellerius zeteki TaxID=64791 RepID=A0A151XJW8_9HYME|nr:hypothetical protein ALC60_00256 [Trachymyrmex zeteki]
MHAAIIIMTTHVGLNWYTFSAREVLCTYLERVAKRNKNRSFPLFQEPLSFSLPFIGPLVDEQLFGHYALLPCNLTDLSRCSLREAGGDFRSTGRVAIHGDPLHLHCRIIFAASETKDRRETKVQGEENREEKKVSVSTGGCSTRKVHVAVIQPWKLIGSPLTRHLSIYHPFEAILYRLSGYHRRSCGITSGSKKVPPG